MSKLVGPGIAIVGDGCAMCGAPVDYEQRIADLLAALEEIVHGQYQGTGLTSDEMRHTARAAIVAHQGGEG